MLISLSHNLKSKLWLSIFLGLIPISLMFSPVLNSIFLIMISIYAITKPTENSSLLKPSKIVLYAYFAFLFFHLIGLLYSFHLDKGLSLIIRRLPFCIIPLVFWRQYDRIDQFILRRTFLYGVIGVAIFTFCNALYSIYLNDDSLNSLFRNYNRFFYVSLMPYELHPTYYGLFLSSALIICLDFIIQRKQFLINLLGIVILGINLFLLSSQMISFICFVVALIFICNRLKKKVGRLEFRFTLTIILMSLLIIAFKGESITNNIIERFEIKSQSNIFYRTAHFFENGDITRQKNWQSALRVIDKNFLLGVGPGDGSYEMQNYRETNTWLYEANLNAHNQFLEEFLHFGFFGFLPFFLFLISTFFNSQKTFFDISIFFCYVLIMMTESILNRQVGIVLFSFSMTIIVFQSKAKQSKFV